MKNSQEKLAKTLPVCPLWNRKTALRVMLGTLGISVLLGAAGKSRAHVATGLLFGALLADHVWTRRKAL